MTDREFHDVIVALRAEMRGPRQDPKVLRVARNRIRATMPLPDGTLFRIKREHLEGLGSPTQIAAALYGVYLEESVGKHDPD